MHTVVQIAVLIILWLSSMVTVGNALNKHSAFRIREFRQFITGWSVLWLVIGWVVIM